MATTPPIVTTVFGAGANDKLLTVDPTRITPATILNTVTDKSRALMTSAIDKLKNNTLDFKDLSDIVSFKDGSITPNSAAAASQLSRILGTSVSSFSDLGTAAQKIAIDQLGLENAQQATQLVFSDGKVLDLSTAASYGSISGVANLLKSISGQGDLLSKLIDYPGQIAIFNTLMDSTIKLGLFSGVETLVSKYALDKDAQKAIVNSSWRAVGSADIDTLKVLVKNTSGAAILAKNPTIFATVLGNYKIPAKKTAKDYPDLLQNILDLFNQVDPHWDRARVNDQWLLSLKPFYKISDDAKKLFMTSATYRDAVMIGRSFPAMNAISLIKQDYPLIAL